MSIPISISKKKGKKSKRVVNSYSFDFRLRAVKLFLEEGFPATFIQKETGLANAVLYRWVKTYQREGEAGLKNYDKRSGNGRRGKLPSAVKDKIVEIKQKEPKSGTRSISNILKRIFFLRASHESVRKTLHEKDLIDKPKRKYTRNITRPRFFERSTPNQLWQTDIFTFRLGGKNAYLIGFIDDYSRYVVGLDLFMSQRAVQVIEVYRRAISEYKVPKEILTDNGRQYTNWRGTSRFEKEIKKDKVHHIKSSPHHPMTLGKIERFWSTIFQQFLVRAQFSSFEEARERIRLWVSYYNHKRPHQGIGGLCPADRYFEIHHEIRKTIEHGIQENILEMALRGKPKQPFYLTGRMDGQSVVLRAEKGKFRMTIDRDEDGSSQELVYNLDEKDNIKEGENTHGKERTEADAEARLTDGEPRQAEESAQCDGDGQGGSIGLDGTPEGFGDLPGVEHTVGHSTDVAEPCHGRNASSVGTSGEPGEGACVESETSADVGKTSAFSDKAENAGREQTGGAFNKGTGVTEKQEGEACQKVTEGSKHEFISGGSISPMAEEGQADIAGPGRETDREGSSSADGCVEEDLLRVGEAGSGGNGRRPGERKVGTAGEAEGSGEGDYEGEDKFSGEGTDSGEADSGSKRYVEVPEEIRQWG